MTPYEAILAATLVVMFAGKWRWILLVFVVVVWLTPKINLIYPTSAIVPVSCNIGVLA